MFPRGVARQNTARLASGDSGSPSHWTKRRQVAVRNRKRDRQALPPAQRKPAFNFFRRTVQSYAPLSCGPNELTSTLLRQYLARDDDDRLKRTFAAAMELTSDRCLRPTNRSGATTACGEGFPPASHLL